MYLCSLEGAGKRGERFEVGAGLSCPEKLWRKGNWIFTGNSVISNLNLGLMRGEEMVPFTCSIPGTVLHAGSTVMR